MMREGSDDHNEVINHCNETHTTLIRVTIIITMVNKKMQRTSIELITRRMLMGED